MSDVYLVSIDESQDDKLCVAVGMRMYNNAIQYNKMYYGEEAAQFLRTIIEKGTKINESKQY